jgi:D-alanyl-D-alanine dipeptidase
VHRITEGAFEPVPVEFWVRLHLVNTGAIALRRRITAPPEVAAHPAGAVVDCSLATFESTELNIGSVLNATDEESSGACYTACRFISRPAQENRLLLSNAWHEPALPITPENGNTGHTAVVIGR